MLNYSNCLKFEHLDFGIFTFGSIPKQFRFQTFDLIPIHKLNVPFLAVLTRLDRFIYKGGHKNYFSYKTV